MSATHDHDGHSHSHSHGHEHGGHGHEHSGHGHEHGGHGHSHEHGGHGHEHEHGKRDCDHCEDGAGCGDPSKNALSTMISRSKAANLARINVFQAIEGGDLPLVHYLITRANPMSIRTQDAEGNTAIHVSARAGHVDLILYFVERGMPVDLLNSLGHTPLMIAISCGRIAACNALLKLGADPNKKDNLGFSPVIHAAQFGSVFNFHHLVANASVDINDMDNDGHSVICWACYNGHKELVEYMLSEYCPMTPHLAVLDQMSRTPMHWAASQNAQEVCTYLATCRCKVCPSAAVDVLAVDDGMTDSGKAGKVCATGKQMFDMRDEDGKTPAECAKAKGHAQLAQVLEFERSGIPSASVAVPAPKKDEERIYQFLSAFLPFLCIMVIGMPYLPHWGLAICCVAAVMMHTTGRVVNWSNKGRTLVPAGLLSAVILGMTWCTVQMNYSLITAATFIFIEVSFLYEYYIILDYDPGSLSLSEGYYKRILDTVAAGSEPPPEYCRNCKIIKPPRSKHCRDCSTCVDRFDHHCYWISNCVGKKNHRRFYLLLLHCVLTIVYFEYMAISFLRAQIVTNSTATTFVEGLTYAYTTYPVVLWMIVFLVFVLVPVAALASFHTNLISKDATTYEMMTKFRSTPGGAPKPHSVARVLAFLQHGGSVFGSAIPSEHQAMNV